MALWRTQYEPERKGPPPGSQPQASDTGSASLLSVRRRAQLQAPHAQIRCLRRAATPSSSGVKRLRLISRDARRSTEVNRDLLYEPDEHLKRDAEFPLCADLRTIASASVPYEPLPTPASRSCHAACKAADRCVHIRVHTAPRAPESPVFTGDRRL